MTIPAPDERQLQQMKAVARQAAARAHCKYSNFPVGAALLTGDGNIVAGCNVENISYGLTNCAERSAIFSAVSQGYPGEDMHALLFYMPGERLYSPCGACRQVIAEFMAADRPVIASNDTDRLQRWSVAQLLPDVFGF